MCNVYYVNQNVILIIIVSWIITESMLHIKQQIM
jgi:hypothetical protein